MQMPQTLRLDDEKGELIILDQTMLPSEIKYLYLSKTEEIWEAIKTLRIRGAPAIGIAAAYGSYLAVRNAQPSSMEDVLRIFMEARAYLATSRPTAVNLFWALDRMQKRLEKEMSQSSVQKLCTALREEADAIRKEDAQVCKSIGESSLSLLKKGWGLLTHCNAGVLATSEYGTALAPIYLGQERGYGFRVFADETRPLLQGARLTAWELKQAGVDVTLICDNMAASVMKKGWVQAVLVGCDRIAANGDTANKIGTLGLAILAAHFGIPFYVHAPRSTIDMDCETGLEIEIEERSGEEITTKWYEKPMAPKGVKVFNPAFDVTDSKLITAIITEKGVLKPPYRDSLRKIME
ncbi:MAG: Methylthioribose-1-phosphate isomerase [Spirochaetes bacterium ADurb.Bin110]|nr:MAG: Methylthioribose-1-phosphate isomerase [Spirochaetes bacterium ADurb.Bin110]